MEQFPKIARARMAGEVAGAHPEAELLNAFAENVLAPKERESVLSHLATCPNCRDIVALAVEARPEGAPLAKPLPGGFRWATFQWAAVAASLAIVTVAVLVVGPKETTRQTESAPAVLQPQPLPMPAQAPAAPASATQSVSVGALKAKTLARREADAKPKLQGENKNANPTISGGTGLENVYVADGVKITDGGFGGIGVYSRAANIDAAKSADKKEAGPAPASRGATGLFYASPGVAPGKPAASNANLPPVQPPAEKASRAAPTAEISAAAPTVADGERAAAVSNPRKDASKNTTESVSTAANLNDTFYQSIPVARAVGNMVEAQPKQNGAAGNTVATRSDSSPSLWRVSGGRVHSSADSGATWQDRNPIAGNVFTAVATSGQNVFAGGKAGAFFASRDNGQSWTKISLTGDVIIPLGDVKEIRLTNTQVLDVILSTGDDWQSNDAGKSFRLLPKKP